MTTTFIAGSTGDPSSRAALRLARRLAAATGGEVLAARVFRQDLPASAYPASPNQDDPATSVALAGMTATDTPDVIPCAVGARSAAEGLHRLAEDEHAVLVAVGATHRGALGRVVPGSVGERLLHGAPCPVAVVPAETRDAPIETVGVAFDGRDASRTALRAGADLASALGARLVLLAVCEPLVTAVPLAAAAQGELDAALVASTEAAAQEHGASIRILHGAAGPQLAQACGDGIDLLVSGSRGYGPVASVLLGSVARHLVDHAPCPVVVVPRAARPESPAAPASAAAEPAVV